MERVRDLRLSFTEHATRARLLTVGFLLETSCSLPIDASTAGIGVNVLRTFFEGRGLPEIGFGFQGMRICT